MSPRLVITASIGTILVTLSFYFLLVGSLRAFSVPFRAIGGISVGVAVVIIAVGQLKK